MSKLSQISKLETLAAPWPRKIDCHADSVARRPNFSYSRGDGHAAATKLGASILDLSNSFLQLPYARLKCRLVRGEGPFEHGRITS
jgi:hypothetical protein